MPKRSKEPSLGTKLKKELRDNQRRLTQELAKTYKDLKSLGYGALSKGRKKLTKKAKQSLNVLLS